MATPRLLQERILDFQQRTVVHLRDSALAHTQDEADLLHHEVLAVIERDDDLLPIRETGDEVVEAIPFSQFVEGDGFPVVGNLVKRGSSAGVFFKLSLRVSFHRLA